MPEFKPMLAADCKGDTSKLRFPLLASPKLDGVRCIIRNGVAWSRSLKPIPNQHIQTWAYTHQTALEGVDGELIVGSSTTVAGEENVMSRTMSGVMRKDGEPDFTFWMFDLVDDPADFYTRLCRVAAIHVDRTAFVPHVEVQDERQLLLYEGQLLEAGYEGAMTRDPAGKYKKGRATMKEQGLVKVKRFSTYEAEVVGVTELMHNENEKAGEGIQKRGTSAAGLVPAGVLGALVCRRPDGVEFNIGTGFTAEQRRELWYTGQSGQQPLTGRTVTYRCFDYGSKEAPRFPVFVCFRNREDMS